MHRASLCILLLLAALGATPAAARTSALELPDGRPYEIPWPSIWPRRRIVWVNAGYGNDANDGSAPAKAVRTLIRAFDMVPANLTQPYHVVLQPGTFQPNQVPDWLRNKRGSFQNPLIIEGLGNPTLRTYLRVDDVQYVYFLRFSIWHTGDADGMNPLHVSHATGILVRGVAVRGIRTLPEANNNIETAPKNTRETTKFNQVQGLYIESCDFKEATDNIIDAVAVQYGHVIWSLLHGAGFGVYFKGGSAHMILNGNRVFDTGEGGLAFSAGFDTGFEWMTRPWIRYEAYDIKLTNNMIYRTKSAGISIYGGYNILVAHNTLYEVGQDVDAVIEVRAGRRTCDGEWVDETEQDYCQLFHSLGGWGPPGDEPWRELNLPTANVIIANNLVLQPPGKPSRAQHFRIDEPQPFCRPESEDTNCVPCTGLDAVVRADTNLWIRGNVLWNLAGDAAPNTPLGFEDGEACRQAPCTAQLIRDGNTFNNQSVVPRLFLPDKGDLRLNRTSLAQFDKLWAIPDWAEYNPGPSGLVLPPAMMQNAKYLQKDAEGRLRTPQNNMPGAFIGY